MPPSHKAVSGLGATRELEVTLQGCAGHMRHLVVEERQKGTGGTFWRSHIAFQGPSRLEGATKISSQTQRGACKDSCVAGKTALLSSLLMVLGDALWQALGESGRATEQRAGEESAQR